MVSDMDMGHPTWQSHIFLVLLAALNASIGMLHRQTMGLTAVGQLWGEGSIVVACGLVTFGCSYIVFFTIFGVAFRWYTTLIFMQQLAHVLTLDGAMRVNLPCYIDLR